MQTQYHGSAERPASLEEETKTTIEEARMVLPGIQALFGFQLIAVFNTRFHDFGSLEQILHLVALLLVAFAIALIMTPAAYQIAIFNSTAACPAAPQSIVLHPSLIPRIRCLRCNHQPASTRGSEKAQMIFLTARS